MLQKNTGQAGGIPKLDLNVEAAWALNITGKNVTTAIMDDGAYKVPFPRNTVQFVHKNHFGEARLILIPLTSG